MKSVETLHTRQSYAWKPVHDWLVDMQFRLRMKDTVVPEALPTEAKCSPESSRLAEKLAIQLEWMRKRGINIRLKESERPSPAKRSPLPGTVIYFSRSF